MSRAWAVAAATEATRVPATGREAAAWRTRGWAEIAFAGLALAEHAAVPRTPARTGHAPAPAAAAGAGGAVPGRGGVAAPDGVRAPGPMAGVPGAVTVLAGPGGAAGGAADVLHGLGEVASGAAEVLQGPGRAAGAAAVLPGLGAAAGGEADVLHGAAGGTAAVLQGLDGDAAGVLQRLDGHAAAVLQGLDGEPAGVLQGLDEDAARGAAEAFRGLDEVVRKVGIRYAGRHAARLRALRALAGPVPPYYLATGRAAQPGAACVALGRSSAVWDACRAIGEFCDAVAEACPGEPSGGGTREGAAADLRWGERHRPSPCGMYTIVRADRCAGLAGRCWMRLPTPGGPRDVFVDVPRRAAPTQERIWRGVHEGAHLDHLAATPLGVEFGYGLMAAETYAMAVEVLATVSCLLAGELDEARWLRAGLVERIGRLPGYGAWLASAGQVPAALRAAATGPSPDFAPLPRLAAVYVRGPLLLLGGHDLGPLAPYLPASLTGPLLDRWAAARAAFPAAAALTRAPRLPGQ
ncbi:hypothetical protein ABGB17_27015 [Sphaerisporangium sp. B11E5]|uniref:hypothetical protein n=1 Tax=Sphaerisporangium sp. B11E5 TaxID=3153563 RepID=UPI00325E781D